MGWLLQYMSILTLFLLSMPTSVCLPPSWHLGNICTQLDYKNCAISKALCLNSQCLSKRWIGPVFTAQQPISRTMFLFDTLLSPLPTLFFCWESRIGRSTKQLDDWRNVWTVSEHSIGKTGSPRRWGSDRGLWHSISLTRWKPVVIIVVVFLRLCVSGSCDVFSSLW